MYSNRYIFIYSTVMVIIVAITLSFIATFLKPYQQMNVKTEKYQNILSCVKIESEKKNAENLFNKYVKEQLLIKFDGTSRQGNAFDISLKAELKESIEEREMPLYLVKDESEQHLYIIPLWGRGLWGPLWGYISLKEDLSTVYGALFDHKSETPGLGAEISNKEFQNMFPDKKIFDNEGIFTSVKVIKGGAPEGDLHAVDAISGGTITSDGVNDMLHDNLSFYVNYFKNIINSKQDE